MPNVIKPSQYNHVHHFRSSDDSPNNVKSSDNDKVDSSDSVVLSSAFEKAKKIVDAANNYSMNRIKEATERMNVECVQAKKQSHDEAYSKGFSLGKKQGVELGYKDGFQKGYEEGIEKAMNENNSLLNKLTLIIETLENDRNNLIKNEEEDLSDLAVQIAEIILQKTVETDKTAITSIIENIVEQNQNKEWIKINISNDVYEVLEKANFFKKIREISNGVKIYHNKNLIDSDCVIEMPDGVIDASVNTQLDKIKAVLKK